MSFDFSTLVIDRSQADLETLRALLAVPLADWTAEQLAEFNQALSKGAYNYTDLNRVTACMDYLNEVLTGLGYETGYQAILVHPDAPPAEDTNTMLLLHGETLTDSSIYNIPVTNAGVVVSADQSKFGGKSLYFNGAAYLSTVELIPQNGDFTVDWWEYVVDRSATRFAQSINGGCGGICAGGANNLNELYISSTGTDWNITNGFDAFSTTKNSWVHWALVRNNDTWTTYRNGVQFSQLSGAGAIYSNSAGLVIGSFLYDSNHYFSGYIDEFRISDVARWTSDFTPPTEPYDVFIPQPQKKDPYVWYETDTPTASQMAQYLENVDTLRGALTLPETIPTVPQDMVGLTQAEANVIEAVLGIINTYLLSLQSIFRRCGARICGGPELYFVN